MALYDHDSEDLDEEILKTILSQNYLRSIGFRKELFKALSESILNDIEENIND